MSSEVLSTSVKLESTDESTNMHTNPLSPISNTSSDVSKSPSSGDTDKSESKSSITKSSKSKKSSSSSKSTSLSLNTETDLKSETPDDISSPESGSGSGSNVRDKKGRSTSCFLCQKRKQKCDQRSPSCTTCIKAGVNCVQPPRYGYSSKPNTKDDYTIMLEKKVKQLEKLLDKANKSITKLGKDNFAPSVKYRKISSLLAVAAQMDNGENETELAHNQQQSQIPSQHQQNILLPQQQQQPLSLPLHHHHQQQHLQPIQSLKPLNSMQPIQKLPIFHPSAQFNSISNNSPRLDFLKLSYEDFFINNKEKYSKSFIHRFNLKEFFKIDPIINVEPKLSKQFLDIYFTLLQYKFPLLNEADVLKYHVDYFSNNDYWNSDNDFNEDDFHFNCARMFLIFSISALLHKTTGKYRGPLPAKFFSTALRHIVLLNNINDLQKIEIFILLVFYLMRSDKDSTGLFEVISDAMKICVSLKLHKKSSYENIENSIKDRRMRCFWCCYLLEKCIAIAVSKPFVLLESKVDDDLPLFDYEPSKAIHPANGTTFINQSIKIRRIEARFIEQLSILSSASIVTKNRLPLVEKFFHELEDWRKECGGFNKGIENETLSVYYYRSVRNLIQPFLELLDPEDKLFKECQAAAGQICQSIKAFHQKTVSGHSTIHIHTTFIAGVTLIYCLWLQRNRDDMRRKLLGDDSKHTRPAVSEALFSGLDDLRACSISLYVMAERTKFALSFRDAFDELMHATIGNLILRCGPDSSEIIYNKEPGMPPAIVRKPLQHYTIESKLDMKITDAEKLEEEERRKRQGQLTCAIPRGLSHLLIHSPPFTPDRGSSLSRFSTLNNAASRFNNQVGSNLNPRKNSNDISSKENHIGDTNSTNSVSTSDKNDQKPILPLPTPQPLTKTPRSSLTPTIGSSAVLSGISETAPSQNSLSTPNNLRRQSISSITGFGNRTDLSNSLSMTTTLTNKPSPITLGNDFFNTTPSSPSTFTSLPFGNNNNNSSNSSGNGNNENSNGLSNPISILSHASSLYNNNNNGENNSSTRDTNVSNNGNNTHSNISQVNNFNNGIGNLSGSPKTSNPQMPLPYNGNSTQQQQQQQQQHDFNRLSFSSTGSNSVPVPFGTPSLFSTNQLQSIPSFNQNNQNNQQNQQQQQQQQYMQQQYMQQQQNGQKYVQKQSNNNNGGAKTPNSQVGSPNVIPELLPFVGRTTAMINNISVWTGESGQQIPNTGLNMVNGQLNNYNNNNNNHNNNNNSNSNNNNNANQQDNNNIDLFSWNNIQSEQFWNVTDDFGFIP